MAEKYPKSEGAGGQKGIDYQVDILALIALDGLSLDGWKLATEHKLAEKFDDIVFRGKDGDFLMQSKHKENMKNVTNEDFFSRNPNNSHFAIVKYFKSFLKCRTKFNAKLYTLCSNICPKETDSIFEKEDKSTLPFPSIQHSYRLKNLEEVKDFLKTGSTTEESLLDEFCQKLRFFHISDSDLKGSLNDKISETEQIMTLKFDQDDFIKKMNDWFMAVNGIYLIKSHVIAFLYEYRSKKYSEELDSYSISFEQHYDIGKNRILKIIPGETAFLKIIKVRKSLQEMDSSKILFINPKDDVNIVLESFELPRFEILFISLCEPGKFDEIFGRICDILKTYSYKKAIIITKEPVQTDLQTAVIDVELNFSDLTETSQNILLSKNIEFQEQKMSIEVLLDNSTNNIDNLIDHRTTVDLIHDTKIEIGTGIRNLGEIEQYYMERTFRLIKDKESIVFAEKDIYNFFDKSDGKFILISDGAGMGKTTILTKLGSLIKEAYPTSFIIRIDLNMFTSVFKKFQKANKESINLEEILESREEKCLQAGFAQNVFSMTNKVILMVDAVDEISPNYTTLVQNFLLRTSERKNISKIFVTTRPHLSMELKLILATKSYHLLPYTKHEQIDFLVKYWVKNLDIDNIVEKQKCKTYGKTLIDKIGGAIGDTSWNFIGIPLQTTMIAQIFQGSDKKKDEWVCCKDFLTSGKELLELPDKLNITKLYDMFVEKKGEIFREDKCNTRGNVPSEDIISNYYKDAINEHQKLAARLLFKDGECKLMNIFKYFSSGSKDTILKMGIMLEIGDELLFVHQTFAEYFVAKTFWTQLNEECSKEFLVFLLSSVFIKEEFEVIRAFFESILVNEFDKIREELYAICGSTVDSISWNGTKNINLLAREGRKHILKLMLEKSEVNKDVLEYDSETIRSYWTSILTRLWLRIRKREKLLNIIDVTTGRTVLSEAIENQEIIEFLLDKGADINKRDKYGRTILHYAAEKCKTELVKFLISRKANVNVGDTSTTPLTWSADKNCLEMFTFLLENGAEMNTKSKESSPLQSAVLRGNLKMVQMLTSRNVDVNKKTENGATALFWAAFMGHSEILVHLLDNRARVNETDDDGETAAHYAASKNNLNCIKVLVARGADVNIKNNKGQRVIDLAILYKLDEIVEYLNKQAG